AHLGGDQRGHLLPAGGEPVAQGGQVGQSHRRVGGGPAVERGPGRGDRGVHVRGARGRHRGHHLFGGRVLHRDPLGGGGRRPRAPDVVGVPVVHDDLPGGP